MGSGGNSCAVWLLTLSTGIIHIKQKTQPQHPSITSSGEPASLSAKAANGYLHPRGRIQAQAQLKTRFLRVCAAWTAQSTGCFPKTKKSKNYNKNQNGNYCKYINHHILIDTPRRNKPNSFNNLGAEAKAIRMPWPAWPVPLSVHTSWACKIH